jgi:hypothetical protein
MDLVKRLINEHFDKFRYALLGGAAIAAVNTLSRPDYNIIIYLYIFYVWTMMTDSKVIISFLISGSSGQREG